MMVFASGAADARTTAAEVVDRESLKGFVETAKTHLEGITDLNEIARLRVTLRTEGEWKSGGMFLMITFTNGDVFIHGDDPAAESKNLAGVEDDNGVKVVERLLEGAGEGGGFVEYDDGGLKTAYAVEYTSGLTGRTLVVVGGYSQDVSDAPITIADLPRPTVTASEVVDRDTLISFVEEAARAYQGAVMSDNYSDLVSVKNALREEGGNWKDGSIYVWIVSGEGIVIFHGGQRHREGKPAPVHLVDVNGVQFLQELIDGGAQRGELRRVPLRQPRRRGRRGERVAQDRLRERVPRTGLGPDGRGGVRDLRERRVARNQGTSTSCAKRSSAATRGWGESVIIGVAGAGQETATRPYDGA